MIEIKFKPETMMVKVTGHAGMDEKGKDIVCSAVSALFYTLAKAVMDSRDALEDDPVIITNDGDGMVSCKPKKEFEGTIQRTYWTILTGFDLLAQEYKDYVSFAVLA